MNKLYLDYAQIEQHTQSILRQLALDNWQPDYIVGITRGGLLPAVLLSQYLNVPMHSLGVNLRDHKSDLGPESNLWMAEDAFGYVNKDDRISGPDEGDTPETSDPSKRKNILIVDDINDTGATLNWIKDDWKSGCMPADDAWDDIFGKSVRFATIVDNEASEFSGVSYAGLDINKAVDNVWVVFPQEEWWEAKP